MPQTIEGAFALGAKEVIVVLPDSKTVHNGSMSSSSVTTGDFERFIAHDLVSYIDAHYRRFRIATSRGLVGHSMGGYGATRIGMKHADVFGSLYIMSPCCLAPRGAGPANPELEKTLQSVKTPADSAALPFFARAQLATAAAWSPNPKNPPLFLDLPVQDGAARPDVLARWAANAPLAVRRSVHREPPAVPGHRHRRGRPGRSRRYREAARHPRHVRHREHVRKLYPGTHTSKVADRFQNHVMTFFSGNLSFEAGRR